MADSVSVNARGELTLLGRRGTIVKIAGRRVNLTEVVAALRGLKGVRDAWVGVSSAREPVLGAVVVAKRPVSDLRMALHTHTAAWKIPKKWAVIATLPLNARGKPDTRALKDLVFG